jgi:hypothetical protein
MKKDKLTEKLQEEQQQVIRNIKFDIKNKIAIRGVKIA